MKKTTSNPAKRCTLYGNLGGDPKHHSTPAKTGTRMVYDPIIDEIVEKEYDHEESNFLTFSVACGGDDDTPPRWFNCIDWEGCAFRARKGDGLELYGYFETRTYTTKQGEPKNDRQFVVENCRITRMKVRDQVS